jgi:predicted nuclease of predicted toxin-antitoxin system
MRYYLDEDLSPKIAGLLRNLGIDCISAHEAGMIQASDLEQLEFASRKERCLVTKNRDDFIRLTVQFFNDHLPHYGVLIIPRTFPGDRFNLIAEALSAYAHEHPKGMHSYTVDFLSAKMKR